MVGFLLFCDFFYVWITISVVTVLWTPCLAGPLEDNHFEDDSNLSSEGSGHDEILEILGLADDEDGRGTLDGMDGFEDHGGGVEGFLTKTVKEKFNLRLDELKVTCFHCLGDGEKGCDVVAMMRDAKSYSISCIGKCLNVSSGTTSVYDCAHDMTSRVNTCFKNGGTEMCFCSGSFCNGPALFSRPLGYYKTPFLFSQILGLDENQTTESENGTDLIGETTMGTDSNLDLWSKGDNSGIFDSGNESVVNQSSNVTNYRNEDIELNSIFSQEEEAVILDSSEGRVKLPYARKTEIDIIIPRENLTDSFETSPEPVDINELSVGNLKDGTIKNEDSPENEANGVLYNSVLISFSTFLLFLFHLL